MDAAQLGPLLASVTALVVAVGHLVADLTGLTDAVKARRKARKRAAGEVRVTPPPAAR